MSFDEILNDPSEITFTGQKMLECIDLMERINKAWLAPYQFTEWDFDQLRKSDWIRISAPDERGFRVWTVHVSAVTS